MILTEEGPVNGPVGDLSVMNLEGNVGVGTLGQVARSGNSRRGEATLGDKGGSSKTGSVHHCCSCEEVVWL